DAAQQETIVRLSLASSAAFGSRDVSLWFSGRNLLCVCQQQAGSKNFLSGGTRPNGSKGFESAPSISGGSGETARVPKFGSGFFLFRTRVVGTNLSAGFVVDGRCGGGASLPAGTGAAGWTGGVQRIFVAPVASA